MPWLPWFSLSVKQEAVSELLWFRMPPKCQGFRELSERGKMASWATESMALAPRYSSSEVEMGSICFPQFLFNEQALTHELIGVCLG